jgi:selenocysteine lyase/cysteine desulfurase
MSGGTGSRSEFEEQPDELPDKFESGTANVVGIAGLGAGLRWVMDRGVETLRSQQKAQTRALLEGLSVLPGVTVYGTLAPERSVSIVSFTARGKSVSEIGLRLDDEFGVLTRVGLHCAPAAHRTIGTFPEGTVRLAPGVFNSLDEIREAVGAIAGVLHE